MTNVWTIGGGTFDASRGGPSSAVYRVDDASQVGEARRAAEALGAAAGLSETERGTLAVVVTEAATNLAKHATGGRVLLGVVGVEGAAGVEVVTIDDGPGIAGVARAMADNYSTAGTAGRGLGAIERMSGEFDLFSQASSAVRPSSAAMPGAPCIGTALVARVWSAAAARARATAIGPARMEVGAVSVPLAGERANGDSWVVLQQRGRTLAVVADGLGHGPEAATASSEAIRIVREMAEATPSEIVRAAHAALRPTRGAALAVAAVEPGRGAVQFAGVGNVAAAIVAPAGTKTLASHNGTVGHVMSKVQEFTYDWTDGATLVMLSDGINTRWRVEAYAGITRHHPSLLAAVLFRDSARGRDDATVLAVRERGE